MTMQPYSGFASIYDRVMKGIPYDSWADYVERVVTGAGGRIANVLDLACGTGNTLLPWAKRGASLTGLDISQEMLSVADAKLRAAGYSATLLPGDMATTGLPANFDLITCLNDSINYLPNGEALARTIRNAHDALAPGGWFVFDINSAYRLLNTPEDAIVIDEEALTLCWENRYLPESGVLEVTLTGFVREGELYRKFREVHHEKAFATDGVAEVLRRTGFEVVGVFHAYTEEPARPDSKRIFFFARRPGASSAATNPVAAQGD